MSNGWGKVAAYSLTDRGGLTASYLTFSLGWTSTSWEKVTSCQGKIASFPGRKVSSGQGGVAGICLGSGMTNLFA